MHIPYWDLTSQLKNILHISTNITGLTSSSSSGQKDTFITTNTAMVFQSTILHKLPDNLWWITVLEFLFDMKMVHDYSWICPFFFLYTSYTYLKINL